MGSEQRMQIGEVADRTGLSLRTIRYYGEVGLVPPSSRSTGGFRLYSEADVARFKVIMRMKPLDFSLDEMRDLLDLLDGLESSSPGSALHSELTERLAMYQEAVRVRVRSIQEQLDVATGFSEELSHEMAKHRPEPVREGPG